MTAAVDHPTLRLVRIAIGPILLGDLAPGQLRELTIDEVAALRAVRDGMPRSRRRTKPKGW